MKFPLLHIVKRKFIKPIDLNQVLSASSSAESVHFHLGEGVEMREMLACAGIASDGKVQTDNDPKRVVFFYQLKCSRAVTSLDVTRLYRGTDEGTEFFAL